jgi:hypothetical protein
MLSYWRSLRTKWRWILLFFVPALLILSNVPHRGTKEGGQGQVSKLSEKVDFWGAILPIVTYDDSARTSFLLSVFSISIYWLGFIMFINYKEISSMKFLIATFFGSIGAVFCLQNLRDAFLLSFSLLSLGFLEKYSKSTRLFWKFVFIVPLIFAVTFKYPTAIAITLLVFLRFYSKASPLSYRKTSLALFSSGLVILAGVILDQSLTRAVSLKQGFVEQSVMYYDLASFYCWSEDKNTRQNALEALRPSLVTDEPRTICLTHRPNAWIYLVSGGNFREEGVVAPLKLLSGDDDAEEANLLRKGWVRTIFSDPIDYVQIKLIAATQILTVGNPFLFAENSLAGQSHPKDLNSYLWLPIAFFLIIIGKSYLFSVFAPITLFIALLITDKLKFWIRSWIVSLFMVHMLNLMVLSIFYVSDEARYVFPLVTLTYLLLVIDYQYPRIQKVHT